MDLDDLEASRRDWEMLHYAVGILTGIAHRYGVLDVTIYHNDIRITITPGVSKEDKSNGK